MVLQVHGRCKTMKDQTRRSDGDMNVQRLHFAGSAHGISEKDVLLALLIDCELLSSHCKLKIVSSPGGLLQGL